jgi:hypothetical protein
VSLSPAAQGIADELDAEGVAEVPIPRRLEPYDLSAVLMATSCIAMELTEHRPDDLYMAILRGSRVRRPRHEWVWIFWTEEGTQQLEEATRRELGL